MEISKTPMELAIEDEIDSILENYNVEITKEQKNQIVDNCFKNDYLFETMYQEIFDEIENVIGDIEELEED